MKSVTIEFPSILDNLRIVESFIDQNREDYHITDDLYGNILIALTEAVNNAIQHGNRHDKDKVVRLTCKPMCFVSTMPAARWRWCFISDEERFC